MTALQTLRGLDGMRSATIFGQSLHLLADTSLDESRLRDALRRVGIESVDVRPTTPSLEDVFVALTAQREAESPSQPVAP